MTGYQAGLFSPQGAGEELRAHDETVTQEGMRGTMKFTMTIDSANAAFEDDPDEETARILRIVAGKIDEGYQSGPLLDRNGNTVGHFSYDDGGA